MKVISNVKNDAISSDGVIRIIINLWFFLLTSGYAFISYDSFVWLKLHWLLLLINIALGYPYIIAMLNRRKMHIAKCQTKCINTFLLLYCSFWLIAFVRGIYLTGSPGYEWMDTITFIIPFTLAGTNYGPAFLRIFFKRAVLYSLVCTVWMFVNILWGGLPPGISEVSPGNFIDGVHIPFPSILFFSFIMLLCRKVALPKSIVAILAIIILIGILLEGHRSMAIAAVLTTLIAHARAKGYYLWIFAASAGLIATLLLPVLPVITNALVSDDSIVSRLIMNEMRLDLAVSNIDLGIGLPSSEASLGYGFDIDNENRFQQRPLTIDAGYLDILLRWGLPLGVAFLIGLFIVATKCRNCANLQGRASLYASALLPLFIVNLTWSIFTWEHGIVLLAAFIASDIVQIKTI